MKRKDVMSICSISATGFRKLVSLDIISRTEDGYQIPWSVTKMFKTAEVAGFLTRITKRNWTIDQVLYVHRDMFFDLHMDKCNKPMLRITAHDFRSLVESTDPSYLVAFDKYYDYSK